MLDLKKFLYEQYLARGMLAYEFAPYEVSSYFIIKKHKDASLDLITIDRTAGLYGFNDVYTFLHLHHINAARLQPI